jgi:hypothetical protein
MGKGFRLSFNVHCVIPKLLSLPSGLFSKVILPYVGAGHIGFGQVGRGLVGSRAWRYRLSQAVAETCVREAPSRNEV